HAEIAPAHVVHQDEDDVGLLGDGRAAVASIGRRRSVPRGVEATGAGAPRRSRGATPSGRPTTGRRRGRTGQKRGDRDEENLPAAHVAVGNGAIRAVRLRRSTGGSTPASGWCSRTTG